jgi:hypothetical protein
MGVKESLWEYACMWGISKAFQQYSKGISHLTHEYGRVFSLESGQAILIHSEGLWVKFFSSVGFTAAQYEWVVQLRASTVLKQYVQDGNLMEVSATIDLPIIPDSDESIETLFVCVLEMIQEFNSRSLGDRMNPHDGLLGIGLIPMITHPDREDFNQQVITWV